MKTSIVQQPGRVSLVIDNPAKKGRERDVLAAMTLYADSECWHLVDIRLARFVAPSPYAGSVGGEHYHASFEPASAAEAEFIKSLLREYWEDEDGSIHWSSFEGIVRGYPEVDGYRPPTYKNFDQAGYLSFREGMAKLKEIQAFWDAYEGDPAQAKIDNPNRQATLSQVMSAVLCWRRERALQVKVGPGGPGM